MQFMIGRIEFLNNFTMMNTGVQGKNNVYHIKEKMRKTNFKLFGKSFLIVDCIGAFIYIIIAQNIRQ
jgi:hypothetical protein